jgi:hypothetical protein
MKLTITMPIMETLQSTEVRGVYPTLEGANDAAREDLLGASGWDRDFFEKYKSRKVGKFVQVKARCPEGEVMTVSVEEYGMTTYPPPTYLVMKCDSPVSTPTIDSVHTNLASAKIALQHIGSTFLSSSTPGGDTSVVGGAPGKLVVLQAERSASKGKQRWELASIIRRETSNFANETPDDGEPDSAGASDEDEEDEDDEDEEDDEVWDDDFD